MTNEEAKRVIDTSEYFWMRPTAKEREALNIAANCLAKNSNFDCWNPVREWPKTTSEDVLVCDIDGDIYKAYMSEYGGWRRSEDFENIKNVVAWMPLPAPYEEGEQ